MQLDTMRIAIRERPFLDIMDLALHVLREYWKPIAATAVCCVVPLMILNHSLLGWMLQGVAWTDGGGEDARRVIRFVSAMFLLVFIQAPLASLMTTVFLGRAAFNDRPKMTFIAREVLKRTFQLVWVYGGVRGVGLAILLVGTISPFIRYSTQEGFLILLALWVFLIRAMRPYINEIILLEQVPMFAKSGAQSVRRRSKGLHGPSAADVFGRFLLSAFFGFCLFLAFTGTFVFCKGILLNNWRPGPIIIKFFIPLSMWLVAVFFSLVRYLSYLDLRIRHEGWEVELRLRAEAVRLTHKVSATA